MMPIAVQEILMSRHRFGIRLFLVIAIACAGGASVYADSATFPLFPRAQYGIRFLNYRFDAGGDATSVGLGPGYFQAVLDSTNSVIGSTYVSDNCRKNDGSCPPELAISFDGPPDANGFRSSRFVKDVHFRLSAAPGDVKVCSVEACQTITAASFQQQGFVDVTVPEITGTVRVSFLTTLPFNVSWRFQIGDHVDFTPVAHADHPIIFIPGIAATELRDDHDDTIWPSLSPFILSSTPLSLDPADAAPPLHATDALRAISVLPFLTPQDVYGDFLRILAANKYPEYSLADPVTHRFDPSRLASNCTVDSPNPQPKLFVFPYDWRRPNAETAGRLANYLKCVQKYYPDQKVDLVAHSMGGLVARRLLLTDPDARAKVRQVVTVATPYLGAAKAIAVEFNGSFMSGFGEILTAATFKKLAPYYPGVHELLPSRPAFPTANVPPTAPPPFRFFDYTPGVAGLRIELADYPTFVDLLDASFPRTSPGSANRAFHDFSGQDDWSADGTAIPVTQYFGTRQKAETIETATRYQRLLLSRSNPTTYQAVRYDRTEYVRGVGDGTVPVGSARRPDALLPAGAKRPIQLTSTNDDALAHNRLPLTGVRKIVALLAQADPTATPSATRLRTESDETSEFPYVATVESVYVSLLGSGPIVLRDLIHPVQFDSSIAAPQWMPGVSVDAESDDSWSLVLTRDTPYAVTFTTTEKPFQVELFQGLSNAQPRLAYRFLDVDLPAGSEVTLQTLTLSGIPQITYSGPNGSGALSPTNISSAGQVDLTPPEITITGQKVITIAATDADSGVWRQFYSTDGTYFHPYASPFEVDPSAVQTIYAFADDFDGNRSGVVAYSLGTATRATSLSYGGSLSGTAGATLILSATLSARSDGAPLAGQAVAFQIAGTTLAVTTDTSGVASVSFTPAHAGDAAVTVSFSGSSSLASTTTAATLHVGKGLPVITWSAPPAITYGTAFTSAQLHATADVPGTFAYLPAPGSIPDAGTATLSAVFTPSNGADYENGAAAVMLTVLRAPLAVSVSNASATYGAFNPASLTGTIAGVVGGDDVSARFTSTATANSPAGSYAIAAGVNDPRGRLGNYTITLSNATLTIVPAPLTVAAASLTATYGGQAPAFAVTYTGLVPGDTPAVLTGTLLFTCARTPLTPPGQYPLTVSGVASPNYAIAFTPGVLTVVAAPVRVTFTGARTASTTGTNPGTVSLLLAATIDPAAPAGARGDLRTATLTFVDRTRNVPLCTAAVEPAGLDGTSGVGACVAAVAIEPGMPLTVGTIVGGSYVRNSPADDVAVTIAPSSDRFLTGGGFLDAATSSGAISADPASKMHFTSDARYKAGRPAIEGRVSIALEHTDAAAVRHAYEVTLPTISSFATTEGGTRAIVTGAGATITDVTDPAHPAILSGGALVEVTATQEGPGHAATLGITVWKSGGGLWFASAWSGSETVEQALGGGALQIH
jgi:pimeloyl-ACP methyl ester carboxylesterase